MASPALTVTPYTRRHRRALLDLVFRSYRAYTHLDWHDVNDWLDAYDAPIQLAWVGQSLVGALGASIPMNDSGWLRIAAIRNNTAADAILSALWDSLRGDLRAMGAKHLSIMLTQDWLQTHITGMGFHYLEDVVTLARNSRILPLLPPGDMTIRYAARTDFPAIIAVDNAAFHPPWQLTQTDFRQAFNIAASCTVAVDEGVVVAYQLTTRYRANAHLARLAVRPDMQGQSVGAQLLHDMLRRFIDRDVFSVTVNTQASNLTSQRLYLRYGFERNGYDLPIWTVDL